MAYGFPVESALFDALMGTMRLAVCLTDPNQPDNPIVYANAAFLRLTGYPADEVLGRNCRFLQGPRTDPAAIEEMTGTMRRGEPSIVEVVNYRRDGTPFWNALHIAPIHDEAGRLRYFFGSQWDVSEVRVARADLSVARTVARELSHRLKNLFGIVTSIVSLTARQTNALDMGAKINERVRAMARAHELTLDEHHDGKVSLRDVVRSVLSPFEREERNGTSNAGAQHGGTGSINLSGPDVPLPGPAVSVIGLVLNELATNAVKYGALGPAGGQVDVTWAVAGASARDAGSGGSDPALRVEWREGLPEHAGPTEPANPDAHNASGTGSGRTIMERLLRASGGSFESHMSAEGLRVAFSLPLTASPNMG